MSEPTPTHVATLVSAPAACLTDALVARAAQLPGSLGTQAVRWLDHGVAADVFFAIGSDAPTAPLTQTLREALGDAPIDVIFQPAAGRRKRLLLADMDSTMIGQECIDELADFVGLKAHVAAITEQAMRGEIAFEPALRARVALLEGLAETIADRLVTERLTLTPGGPALVATMRANGAHTALVSGGFTLFTSKIAAMIGFHENRANVLMVEAGRFTGFVAEPILGRAAKRDALVELREWLGLTPGETLAVGDGANDLAMLAEAGLGVAFHAKPAVAAAAHARIDHSDLTALLYAQGYRREEFIA
jgi:phosphoserine phosphatase